MKLSLLQSSSDSSRSTCNENDTGRQRIRWHCYRHGPRARRRRLCRRTSLNRRPAGRDGSIPRGRDTAVAQLKQLRDNVAAEFGENKAELFDAHRLMLQDPDYAECVEGLIAQDKVNAEFAVKSAAEQFAAMFAAMDSSTMQARAADVKDVSRRVMNVLQGKRDSTAQDGSVQGDAVQNGIVQNGIAQNGESHIIFAEDLAPSDTAQLDRAKVLGLVTAKGSANSHTAILARTMGLPAITGIGDAFDPADDGHVAVIDGTSGAVFVDPDEATLTEYRRRKAEAEGAPKPPAEAQGQAHRNQVRSAGPPVRQHQPSL